MANEIKPGCDGLYAVCFTNDKGYNEKKIWEIFGRYGHVVSVRFNGPEHRAFVFVRYRGYNETKNCLEDLNKSKELSVRMAIPTKKLQQIRTSQFSGDKASGSDSINFKKPFRRIGKHDNGQIRNVGANQGNCHTENENSSTKFEWTKQNGEDPVDDRTINIFSGLQSDCNTQGTIDTKKKVDDDNRDLKHLEKEDACKNSDNRGQMLQYSYTSNGIVDDGPPPLVDSEDLPHHLEHEPVVYATDVIVANLPPTVDEWDVVCLARRHDLNPVHVSAVERTGFKYNIPFCHLWMENDYEADIAEFVLRGKYLEGKALLVARAEDLLGAFHDGPTPLQTA